MNWDATLRSALTRTMESELSSSRVQRLQNLAVREAFKSGAKKKHGAIVFRKGRIISSGFNKLKTHPKCQQQYKYLHAEEDALIKAGILAKGADIYVIRLIRDGLGLSRPCETCLQVLREAEVRNIYYSTNEGEIERL